MHDDDDFIRDSDDSSPFASLDGELTGWEVVVFELVSEDDEPE